MKPSNTKQSNIRLITFALKTVLYIILFAGFPLFIGTVSYNYNVEAKSLLEIPLVERMGSL